MTAQEEIKLFEAPDLAALQRNWPRIALRAAVLLVVPFCVTMLARSLDLYRTIAKLPLPLEFLDAGPFAYEGKVVFAIVATLLGIAFLIPKRTSQLVIAICVGSIVWTGHVFISLQWARLFATQFDFRAESSPGPLAWLLGSLILVVGVVFLLLENLLDTREQQEGRALPHADTRALAALSGRTLGLMLGAGAALAVVLVGAYAGLRALTAGATLPVRIDPVFALFVMGLSLAVLVALAARKRTPAARPLVLVAPAPVAAAAPSPPLLDSTTQAPTPGRWRRMTKAERTAVVLSVGAILVAFMPWLSFSTVFGPSHTLAGLATMQGVAMVVASSATLFVYLGKSSGRVRRIAPAALWGLALATFPFLVVRLARGEGPLAPQAGAFLGFLLTAGLLSATLFAARRPKEAPLDA